MSSFSFWSPQRIFEPRERPAITLISGFLGAGKTTFLNHCIKEFAQDKVALLVNDLGSVNIDASLVNHAVQQLSGAISGMIELSSGCICCSIQNQLMDALIELLESHQQEHIIIEATGVADPRAVLENLGACNLLGIRGVDVFRVANLITVVDAAHIGNYLVDANTDAQWSKRHHLHQVDRRRPLEELALDQIECADVLLLNKVDAVSPEALAKLDAQLRSLNPRAEVQHCQFAKVDVPALMAKERFDATRTPAGSRWQMELNAASPTQLATATPSQLPRFVAGPPPPITQEKHPHRELGLESFVYHARRPVEAVRFFKLMREGIPNVLRAKGFYWTQEHPDRIGFLSIAGKILRADYMDHWWVDRLRCGQILESEVPDPIRQLWVDDEIGDRRQELVFIGQQLNRSELREQLDACLV